ncbi:MAG: hypothetical protein CVU81_01260 [Euryarchaeota archaeon HGW-Euryarchaeota-1]|nr:MAG: hypothetical protein CVU81_01260 [Euryarchaeota archaeon HGW-Euryarchaeota-1]
MQFAKAQIYKLSKKFMSIKTLDDLLKLADLIKNKDLRAQVRKVLKNPQNDCYPNDPVSIKDCPGGPWHHTYRGGLIDHIYGVTAISLNIAKSFSEIYGEKINLDYLISACLLHDIMKIYDYAYIKGKKKVVIVDNTIRHGELGGRFLFEKGLPEEICIMVSQHLPLFEEDNNISVELRILLSADKLDTHILFARTLLFDDYIISSADF